MKCRHFSSGKVQINLSRKEKRLIQAGLMAGMTKLHRPNDAFGLLIALKVCSDPLESHRENKKDKLFDLLGPMIAKVVCLQEIFFEENTLSCFTALSKRKGFLRTVCGQLLLSLCLYSPSTRRFLIKCLLSFCSCSPGLRCLDPRDCLP